MALRTGTRARRTIEFRDPSHMGQLETYLRRLKRREITPQSITGTAVLFHRISRKDVYQAIYRIKNVDAASIMRAHAQMKRAVARQKKVHG